MPGKGFAVRTPGRETETETEREKERGRERERREGRRKYGERK